MILLDTNVISELRRPVTRRDPAFNTWAVSTNLADAYLSTITVMELRIGVARKQRTDPVQGQILASWLARTTAQYTGRILPVTIPIAAAAAPFHVPDPRNVADSLIAATAQVHNLVLATRNESDFVGCPITIVNPWTSPD